MPAASLPSLAPDWTPAGDQTLPGECRNPEAVPPGRKNATGQLGSNRLSIRRETLAQIERQTASRWPAGAIADYTLEIARRLIYFRAGSVFYSPAPAAQLEEIASKYGGLDEICQVLQSPAWIESLATGSQSILDGCLIPPTRAVQGITAILVTPLIDRAELAGALCLGLTYSCEFRPDLMEITQEFADALARALRACSRELQEIKAVSAGGCAGALAQLAAADLPACPSQLRPGKIRDPRPVRAS